MAVRSVLVLIIVVLAAGPGRSQVTPDGFLEERTKVRLREVWLRVRPVSFGPPGACRDLGLDDLKVSVGGRPVPRELLLSLERRTRRTLHAILIDASRSAAGKMDFFRSAAVDYVRTLGADDTVLVASFDESVILLQPATSDHALGIRAIEGLRMGQSTSLNDGLYFVLRELEAHRERPVVLLITDGFDTTSMFSRDDVNALAESRPDQTVFTIGVGMPPIVAGGPPGMASIRRFLQRLAWRTNGHHFNVPTGGRLDEAFARIRQMLDDEHYETIRGLVRGGAAESRLALSRFCSASARWSASQASRCESSKSTRKASRLRHCSSVSREPLGCLNSKYESVGPTPRPSRPSGRR